MGETDHTGTTVTFKPDPEMFDTLDYDYETLHTRMREQAFLNAGLRITITDAAARTGAGGRPCATRAASASLSPISTATRPRCTRRSSIISGAKGDSHRRGGHAVQRRLQRDAWSPLPTTSTPPEGGMHETGFKAALTRVLNAYGLKYGMIKEGDKVSGEDVPGGHHRRDLREADRGPVRGPDQGQAGQRPYPHTGGRHRLRPAGGVSGGAPRGGPDHSG